MFSRLLRTLFFILFIWVALGAKASAADEPSTSSDEACAQVLAAEVEAVDEHQIARHLQSLPPPEINHRNLNSTLRGMSRDLAGLRQRAGNILDNERQYVAGKKSHEDAIQASQSARQELKSYAHNLMQKPSPSLSERRQLEGARVLLDRTRRVENHSRDELEQITETAPEPETSKEKRERQERQHRQQAKNQNEQSAEKSTEPKNQKQSEKNNQHDSQQDQRHENQNEKREKERQQNEDRNSDEPTSEKQSNENKLDRENKPSDDRKNQSKSKKPKQQNKSDSQEQENESSQEQKENSPSKDEKESKNKQKNQKQKPGDQQKEKNQQKSDQKSDGDDKADQQSEDQQQGDGDQQGEQEGESQQQGDGKEEGDGQKQGQGKPKAKGQKPGQGQPQDGDEQGDGEPGEGEGPKSQGASEDGEKGEPSSDDANTNSGANSQKERDLGDTHQRGSDGLNEGASGAEQSLMDKLSEFFKNAIKENLNKDDPPTGSEPVRQQSEAEKIAREQMAQIRREAAERLKSMESSQREADYRSASKSSATKNPADPMPKTKAVDKPHGNLRDLNSTQKTTFLHKMIERLLVHSLRNYSKSENFNIGLGQVQTTIASLSGENANDDKIRQLTAEVRSIRESLEAYQVQYKDLESLGLSMLKSIGDGATDSMRKVRFINEALTSLGQKTSLTVEEARVLDMSRRVIAAVEDAGQPSDQDFCEAFLRQLVGPLSRKVVLNQYKSESMRGGYDYASMARAIRQGQFNDLLIQAALNPYMNLLLNSSMTPKDRLDPNGEAVVINDKDPNLEMAQELDNFQQFYRDGSPTKIDLQRFLSGDMLQNVYHEDQIKSDPKTLHPKKVSFVLYDVSGSMGSNDKFVLRNALILAYLDRSQKEVQAGDAEHIVYLMAFDGKPHKPERIQGLTQAQSTFERLRTQPLGAGGQDSISGALIDVYERIAAQQAEGGELNRANILLLTDAVAPVEFANIEKARNLITSEVDVRLNAITMGDLNEDVSKLIEMAGGEGQGKLGLVAHQHIDYTQVERLLNASVRVDVLNKTSKAFNSAEQNRLSNDILLDLKNRLVGLEVKRSIDDNSRLSSYNGLVQMLKKSGPTAADLVIATPFAQYKRLAISNASKGWSTSEKLESFWTFASDLGKETSVIGEEIVGRVSEDQRETLRRWMGI